MKDKKMKKHPIDDLFREKLSGFEKQPTDKAWVRIAQETQKSRRAIGWLWYAAAGIAVTLLAGYLVWQNDSVTQKPAIAQTTDPITAPITPEVAPLEEIATVENETTPQTIETNRVAARKEVGTKVKQQKALESRQQNGNSTDEQVVIANAPSATEHIEIHEPEHVLVAAAIEAPDDLKKMPLVKKQEESRTIIVQVDPPVDAVEEKVKNSRLGKIFRQLKNVKEGEPVDWKDMGFNPKTVVARVDNRLRQGEEKLSEKYQDIKERTKF